MTLAFDAGTEKWCDEHAVVRDKCGCAFKGMKPGAKVQARLKATRASAVPMRAVRWLWHKHIPKGEVILIAGREGIGKSTFSYRMVAQITLGTLDGEHRGEPRDVIVVATEDSWAHTIVPRLVAEGADLDRVIQVEGVELLDSEGVATDVPVLLPRDLDTLEVLITSTGAALVLLDPLMSRMSGELDTHVDRDVRQALEPLARVAHDTGATVGGIIHMNKSAGTDVLTTIMGSRAFSAVARAVIVAMRDPADPARRLVGIAKSNLGPDDLPAWAFTVEGVEVGVDPDDGRPIIAARYVDHGRHATSIREAGIQAAEDQRLEHRERTSQVGRAEVWLRDQIDAAGPGGIVKAEALMRADAAGLGRRAVERAASNLEVTVTKGFQGSARWERPTHGWPGAHGRRASSGAGQIGEIGEIGEGDPDLRPVEGIASPQVSPNFANLANLTTPPAREARDQPAPTPLCRACGYRLADFLLEAGVTHHPTCTP